MKLKEGENDKEKPASGDKKKTKRDKQKETKKPQICHSQKNPMYHATICIDCKLQCNSMSLLEHVHVFQLCAYMPQHFIL